jgi:hypothetical protein
MNIGEKGDPRMPTTGAARKKQLTYDRQKDPRVKEATAQPRKAKPLGTALGDGKGNPDNVHRQGILTGGQQEEFNRDQDHGKDVEPELRDHHTSMDPETDEVKKKREELEAARKTG